ncbi:MAG: class I SAM-dependent methyltransferase [Candidatus Levybacteria bacterium]|nr:class I SAM-dependent methyltransferase [Candidatus Levybacteria bacterium]
MATSKLTKELKTKGWDRVANVYARDRRAGSMHHRFISDPALFAMIGEVTGKRVLDAGCGEGIISRKLAEKGAEVVGVDLSEKLIELAQKEVSKNHLGIKFYHASLTDLSTLEIGKFDMIVSNLVLHDLEPLDIVLDEFNKALKSNGELVLCLQHPMTNGEEYFEAGWHEYNWEGDYMTLAAYNRMLSDYINGLTKRGFMILEVIEPRPTKEGLQNEKLREWDKKPLFLLIKALKKD